MTKYTFAFTFTLICFLLTPFAARAVTVPAGTFLWVRTLDPVSSSDKAGKSFAARLDANLVVNNKVVIPAGSKVYGYIESSKSTGSAFGHSKLALSLREILVNGRPLTITTATYEESGSRSGRKTDSIERLLLLAGLPPAPRDQPLAPLSLVLLPAPLSALHNQSLVLLSERRSALRQG